MIRSDQSYNGVLLVGHGTRDEIGTRQFFELSELLAERLAGSVVQPCLLEFQEPTISQAWQMLVDRGVTHITVSPLLLFAAGHAKEDIPSLVEECRAKSPPISVSYSRPISRHPSLVMLVCEHLSRSLSMMKGSKEKITLLMVGRGSYDPCAQADMKVLSDLVAHRIGVVKKQTAFYAMAEPRFRQSLEQLAKLASGHEDSSILIHPHLLFDGRLHQSIEEQVKEVQRNHPRVSFHLSSYLGPHEWIAQAIASRISSAPQLASH